MAAVMPKMMATMATVMAMAMATVTTTAATVNGNKSAWSETYRSLWCTLLCLNLSPRSRAFQSARSALRRACAL
eukprot:10284701-Alexandrium_andersonii.AAC.1